MANWKKEEVRVWVLPPDVTPDGVLYVVGGYPGDRWASWTYAAAKQWVQWVLDANPHSWPCAFPSEPYARVIEACRNGEMDEYLDPEFGPKEARHAQVDSKIAYGSKKSEPFRRALTEVWRVSVLGAKKHGANNWQSAQAEGMHFYEDALWRHLQDRRMGLVTPTDSPCYTLAHAAWNALMMLEMELRGVTNPEWEEHAPHPDVEGDE